MSTIKTQPVRISRKVWWKPWTWFYRDAIGTFWFEVLPDGTMRHGTWS